MAPKETMTAIVPLYKSVISHELRDDLLTFYKSVESQLPNHLGRRQCRNLPDDLSREVIRQVQVCLSGYYADIKLRDNARIYGSDYGVVRPHRDVPIYSSDNCTILIYLTDDFNGGALTVKTPRSAEHIAQHGQPEKGHIYTSVEPRICYGVVFMKDNIHYTDELLGSNKVILLLDAAIVF